MDRSTDRRIGIVACPFFNEVDRPVEQVLECQKKSEIGIRALCRRKRMKFDQEIEVAPARFELAGSRRTKERQPADLVAPT